MPCQTLAWKQLNIDKQYKVADEVLHGSTAVAQCYVRSSLYEYVLTKGTK